MSIIKVAVPKNPLRLSPSLELYVQQSTHRYEPPRREVDLA